MPGVKRGYQLFDECWFEDGVRIQEEHIFRGKAACEFVVSLTEARVHVRSHEIVDIEWLDDLEGFVVGSVVENMKCEVAERLLPKTIKACLDVGRTVERDDVDRDSFHARCNKKLAGS